MILSRLKLLLIIATTSIAGCASPHVVDATQLGDENLTCREIELQVEEAKRFERQAKNEKGVTGTNVAAAIFFWPALFVTYDNSGDAIEAAQERRRVLKEVYLNKRCATAGSTNNTNNELTNRLRELKELLTNGAITKEEYEAAKKKALGL